MHSIVRAVRKQVEGKTSNKLRKVVDATKIYALKKLKETCEKPKSGVKISLQPDGTTRYNKSQRYKNGVIIRRSAPGETPAKITCRLINSNNVDIYRTEHSIMIRLENTAPYAYLFDGKTRKNYFQVGKKKQWYTVHARPYLSTVTDQVKKYMIKKFKEVQL